MRVELKRILAESVAIDAREDQEGAPVQTDVRQSVASDQMRDIVRRVRSEQAERKRQETAAKAASAESVPASEPLAEVPETVASETVASEAVGTVERESLRESLRESRLEAESASAESPVESPVETPVLTAPMRASIERAITHLDAAKKDERGHLCLTDSDARMLGEGRSKQLKECHSFEIAMDNGLIVAAGVTTEQDNGRLLPLVEAAAKNEPDGVTSVDADSGYWGGDAIAKLETEGITTCVPTTQTACDLRKGLPVGTTLAKTKGSVPFTYDSPTIHLRFTYDATTDTYHCPEGNTLIFLQQRRQDGQTVCKYRASAPCDSCPRASECLINKGAKRRHLSVGVNHERIGTILARFRDQAWQARYYQRAPAVETVFGFVRGTLGFTSWLLRGTKRVACEATLFKTAYQFRKICSHKARAEAEEAKVAVKITLAELIERNVVAHRPVREAGKLDAVIADGLRGEGGFFVEKELA